MCMPFEIWKTRGLPPASRQSLRDRVKPVSLTVYMARPAKFQVDPRLATLLGATYRSSEQAIQELVDNVWDADAEHVWITLPDPVTPEPVVGRDVGCGRTDQHASNDYLNGARARRAARCACTP